MSSKILNFTVPLLYGGAAMQAEYHELVITCEKCKTVTRMDVGTYEECLERFSEFQCPNGCGRNMYSYFTVGRYKEKNVSI